MHIMSSVMKWFLILTAFIVAVFFLVPNGSGGMGALILLAMPLAFAWLIFPLWSAEFLYNRGHDTWATIFVMGTIFGLGGVVTGVGWLVVLGALADPVVRQ